MGNTSSTDVVIDEFFVCQCHSNECTLRFQYNEWSGYGRVDRDIVVTTYLDHRQSLWKRLKIAWRYVRGLPPTTFHFGDTIISDEDVRRLHDLTGLVLSRAQVVEVVEAQPSMENESSTGAESC